MGKSLNYVKGNGHLPVISFPGPVPTIPFCLLFAGTQSFIEKAAKDFRDYLSWNQEVCFRGCLPGAANLSSTSLSIP